MNIGSLVKSLYLSFFVIILIIFGAGKLPEIGSGLGKGIKNFKKATRELKSENEPFDEENGAVKDLKT